MKKRAFTILEILVVLSVIAILIGIAIPRFKGMQDASNIIRMRAELRTLQAAMEAYKNDHTYYADTIVTMEEASPKIVNSGLLNPMTGAPYSMQTDGVLYYVIYAKTDATGSASISGSGVVSATNAYWVSNGTVASGHN